MLIALFSDKKFQHRRFAAAHTIAHIRKHSNRSAGVEKFFQLLQYHIHRNFTQTAEGRTGKTASAVTVITRHFMMDDNGVFVFRTGKKISPVPAAGNTEAGNLTLGSNMQRTGIIGQHQCCVFNIAHQLFYR